MGSQNRAFLDAPLHGRRLTLQVDRQRYRCANGHSPSQPLPDMVEGKQMTVRALRYIEHQCVRIPHSVIADRLKVTPKTVRDIALEYYGKLDLARRPAIVERLEVWATEFGGVDAVLLVDRGRGRLVDLIRRDEWAAAMAGEPLRRALDLSAVRSIFDPSRLAQPLIQSQGWEEEGLPPAVELVAGIRAARAASKKSGFPTAQARVRLWGDLEAFLRGTTQPFDVVCDGCSAACTPGETQKIRTRQAIDGKSAWRDQTLCTACLDYRVPVWFQDVRNMTKGE